MRNPELTRQRIIEHALPLFNQKGYQATSLSDITKATGITKGAIYSNFRDKDEVAMAAFEHGLEIILSRLRQRIKAQPTAPLKLKALVDYYEDYVLNPPIPGGCPILNTSVEADDNYPLLRARVIRSITVLKDSFRQMLLRGLREQQLRADIEVDELTHVFYATIEGAIMVSRVEGDGQTFGYVKRMLYRIIDEMTMPAHASTV